VLAALDKVMKSDRVFRPVAAAPNRKAARHRDHEGTKARRR
jgi:hypothetical protein